MFDFAAITTSTSSVCPKCGIADKSGKTSCCGLGGSWFGHCGQPGGGTKVNHTWHEGLQACKAWVRSRAVIAHQLGGAQQRRDNEVDSVISKGVTMATEQLRTTPATSIESPHIVAPVHALANALIGYAGSSVNPTPVIAAVTTVMSVPTNITTSTPKLRIRTGRNSTIRSALLPMSHDSTPFSTLLTSQGCRSVLDVGASIYSIYTGLSLAISALMELSF